MANQQLGTPEHGRLPQYSVHRRWSEMARSCSCLCETNGPILVAGLYPDGYSA
jgi:hypothetical protein